MNIKFGVLLLAILSCSCASQVGYRNYFKDNLIKKVFPEQEQEKLGQVGELIYETYTTQKVEFIELVNPVNELMPGPLKVPFRFNINATNLVKQFEARDYSYFVAPQEDANADVPGGIRMIRNEDIMGVRISSVGVFEWYIDSSAYNTDHIPRLWTKAVSDENRLNLIHKKKFVRSQKQEQSGKIELYSISAEHIKLLVRRGEIIEIHTASRSDKTILIANGELQILEISAKNRVKYKWLKLPQLYKTF